MAFVLLLMVGVSFSLSGRTVVVEKVVQVPVPQPVLDNVARIVAVLQLGDVSRADKIISLGIPLYTNFRSLDNQHVHLSAPPC